MRQTAARKDGLIPQRDRKAKASERQTPKGTGKVITRWTGPRKRRYPPRKRADVGQVASPKERRKERKPKDKLDARNPRCKRTGGRDRLAARQLAQSGADRPLVSRQRIFRATQQGDMRRVHMLQKLMLRSYSNTLVSVRRVTRAVCREAHAGRGQSGHQDPPGPWTPRGFPVQDATLARTACAPHLYPQSDRQTPSARNPHRPRSLLASTRQKRAGTLLGSSI